MFYFYFYFIIIIINYFILFFKKKNFTINIAKISLCANFRYIAKFRYVAKFFATPPDLPLDFVSPITFSSELRFRRFRHFRYRWKS